MSRTVSNPQGAFGYTTLEQTAHGDDWPVKLAVAVSKGDVLAWTAQATDIAPTVIPAITGTTDPSQVCGVALEAGAVGDTITMRRSGLVLVNIDTGTVAANERAILLAGGTGKADGIVADATTIEGDTFGVFLGAEVGTTNQAVLDVRIG